MVCKKTLEWLACLDGSYLATALCLPFSMDGVSGVLALSSTGESTRICNAATAEFKRLGMITEPHWLFFEVHWYAGVALLEVAGMTRQRGVRQAGVFQDFLSDMCVQRVVRSGARSIAVFGEVRI